MARLQSKLCGGPIQGWWWWIVHLVTLTAILSISLCSTVPSGSGSQAYFAAHKQQCMDTAVPLAGAMLILARFPTFHCHRLLSGKDR